MSDEKSLSSMSIFISVLTGSTETLQTHYPHGFSLLHRAVGLTACSYRLQWIFSLYTHLNSVFDASLYYPLTPAVELLWSFTELQFNWIVLKFNYLIIPKCMDFTKQCATNKITLSIFFLNTFYFLPWYMITDFWFVTSFQRDPKSLLVWPLFLPGIPMEIKKKLFCKIDLAKIAIWTHKNKAYTT